MKTIPIAKPYLTEDEAKSAYDAVMSGWVTQGPGVQKFEENFAAFTGSKYAVAVSSCTAALHLSMLLCGVGTGDEVICPSLSYIATANSIIHAGAKPVFAEINPENLNISVENAEKLIGPKTKAILIVHQVGMPADIDKFKILCEKYNLKLIEDAACATGSAYKGKRIGTHSEIVCFSFHPRKVITTGDGGMITTSNEKYYNKLKLLRQHGMSVSDRIRHESKNLIFEEYVEIGYNYRMTDIQAAVGIRQLEKLDLIIDERRKIAGKYYDSFKNIPFLRLTEEKAGYFTNYQSYWIYLKNNSPVSRDEAMQKLSDKGISVRRGIMTSHREPAYIKKYGKQSLPVSEDISDNSLIIPLYVPMEEETVDYIIHEIRSLFG